MSNIQQATLGGGCFWCVEAIVQRLKGVSNVISGYAGGTVPGHPTYREICSGLTGHAEVIQFDFDPTVITYAEILMVFLTTHDPTTLNRQGADRGTQYRSVIFYHNDAQKEQAEKVIQTVQEHYDNPIVTEVSPAPTFYEATLEHQDYYNENRQQGYCRIIIDPKIKKLRDYYSHLMR